MQLFEGDCLEVMKQIPDASVDLVLCDLPYGTTQCKWDSVIPFAPLWASYRRVIKPFAPVVLTASQPFTSALIMSNIEWFKYCWIWEKDNASNFFAAKFQPLNNTEDVVVFSAGGCNNGTKNAVPYFPQGLESVEIKHTNGKNVGGLVGVAHKTAMKEGREYTQTQKGYPLKTLKFTRDSGKTHPTQKPIALMEYLIRTYTLSGALVLDNTMGSGSTGVACANTGRRFIGIEQDPQHFQIAKSRVDEALVEYELFGEK